MKTPPFTLPKDPVDRYEVRWYEVDTNLYTIRECRAVYHVHSSWRAVVGDNGDTREGAPFVNEWQIFRAAKGCPESFTGRSRHGWHEAWEFADWSNDYATRSAARQALRKAIFRDIERAQEELEDLQRQKDELDEEAWNEWEKANPE